MKVMKKMSVRFAVRVEFVLVLLPLILLSISPCAAAVSGILCRKAEREALLDFKLSFTADRYGSLSSWSADNPDCCTQWGYVVGCDGDTGHVVELYLVGGLESHQLRPSLLVLQHLTLLDLSGNNFTMRIPEFIGSLTNLETLYLTNSGFYGIWANESVEMLSQLNVIDLSNNCLTGKIPSGFTSLKYLKSLDLSSNNLTGSIPDKIGELKYMEVLELSSNKLSGEIPQSLADLTFLDTLNLSSNNLSGEIPKSTQLQSFDPSSYGANAELCGDPLPTSCPWDNGILEPPRSVRDHAEEEEEGHGSFDFEAFYAALGAGFASGLFGILGIIHFHAPSRHAFFHMASEVGDWIFVWTILYKSRIKRKLSFSKKNDAARI